MAVSTVTGGKSLVPGKTKMKVAVFALSGTYTNGGEAITAKQFGMRRLVSATASLAGSNATEATPVGDCWVTIESGVGKLHLLNGKTAAELAAGITVVGVKVEIIAFGY